MRNIAVLLLAIAGSTPAHADRSISFDEAVRIALAHNGELLVAETDIDIATTDIAIARSSFDHRILASVRTWKTETPGTALAFESSDVGFTGALAFEGRASTGAVYSLELASGVERFSSAFSTVYKPAYTTGLTATLTQPLLRGGWSVNRAPIKVAVLRRDLTEQQLRVRLEQIVGQVEVAYWNLALAHKEREARAAVLKLAKEQLSESQRLVKIGTISELDVLEAKAGINRAEQAVIRGEQSVADAEGKLHVIVVGTVSKQPDEAFVPSDDPVDIETSYSVSEHVELARKNRPDVAFGRSQIAAEEAGLAITANGRKPQVDLVVSAGLIGFAGEVSPSYFTQGVIDNTLDPPFTADPELDGGAGRSFRNLVRGQHYAISVGLQVELPLENTAAKARHDRQRLLVERARQGQQSLLERVESEIRTSITLLKQDEALRKSADEAVTNNEKLLVGMRKRFANGAVTTFDVLRVADELARAQIDAVRARVSYRVSLVRLALLNGTLLPRNKIEISSIRNPPPAKR